MKETDIPAMLQADRAAWDELVALLDAHPGVSLHDAGSPAWSSRIVYAHLARWMEHSTAAIRALAAGVTPPPLEGTDEEINARFQREDADLSLDEARQWAMMTFGERERTIESIPSYLWNDEIENYARADGASHFRAHLSYITLSDPKPVAEPSAAAVERERQGGKGMYEIIVENHFEAAHYLRGYEGKCESMHGHRYKVVVRIQVTELNDIGLSWDFTDVKAKLSLVLERLDHTCLNDLSMFETINPSAENIAAYIYHQMEEKLTSEPAKLLAVEAWETPYQGVSYRPG